jgi:hypothetical protein
MDLPVISGRIKQTGHFENRFGIKSPPVDIPAGRYFEF